MKRIIMATLLVSLASGSPVKADPNYAVVGAILGATAGLVIGNNIDGISREIAVPICAIAGGLIGHEYGQHRHYYEGRDRYYRDRYGHRPRYGNNYYPYKRYDPDDWYGRDYRYSRWDDSEYRYYPPKTVTTKRYTPKKINASQFTVPDPHPGVDLIKVTVLNVNGIKTEVPIMRVNNQYIGPQGETFKSLPTAEQLRKKYGL